MAYGQAITALADPTRRRILERLRRRERSVGEIAEMAKISQPAASQHLRVLQKARLVHQRSEGTRRYYRASVEGLIPLRRYIESYWDNILTSFAEYDSSR